MRKLKDLFFQLLRIQRSQDAAEMLRKSLKLFEKSTKGKPYNISLSTYLDKFFKKNPGEKICPDVYSVYLYYHKSGEGYGPGGLQVICVDAVYSFVLFQGKEPICSIGFNLKEDNSILVKQIQGVKGKQKELSSFRWEKMLLQIVIDWAKSNKLKKVSVIRSVDSKWHNSEYQPKRSKRMYIKYDVTAQRMGFVYDKEKMVYSLYL